MDTRARFQPGHDDDLDPLVAGALAGDRGKTEALFAAIAPVVHRYCRRRLARAVGGVSDVDDVTQEVLVAVLRSLPRYRVEVGAFLPFVFGIAAHRVADYFRARSRGHAQPVAELPDVVDPGPVPETVVDSRISVELERSLWSLSERTRRVLLLRVLVGLSAQETGRVTGLSEMAVRTSQHRALKRLRQVLASHPGHRRAVGVAGGRTRRAGSSGFVPVKSAVA